MAGKMREPSKTAAKGGRGGLLMATSASSPKQRRSTAWQLPLVDVFKYFDAAGGTRCAKTGDVTKHTDKTIRKDVFRLQGSVPAANTLHFPKVTSQSLGLVGAQIYLTMKAVGAKNFVMHFDLATDAGVTIRLSISSMYKAFKATPTWLQLPFRANALRWTVLHLNLDATLRAVTSRKFACIKGITLCANMLVRNVIVTDAVYTDPDDFPKEMRLFVSKDSAWLDEYELIHFPLGDHPTTGDPAASTDVAPTASHHAGVRSGAMPAMSAKAAAVADSDRRHGNKTANPRVVVAETYTSVVDGPLGTDIGAVPHDVQHTFSVVRHSVPSHERTPTAVSPGGRGVAPASTLPAVGLDLSMLNPLTDHAARVRDHQTLKQATAANRDPKSPRRSRSAAPPRTLVRDAAPVDGGDGHARSGRTASPRSPRHMSGQSGHRRRERGIAREVPDAMNEDRKGKLARGAGGGGVVTASRDQPHSVEGASWPSVLADDRESMTLSSTIGFSSTAPGGVGWGAEKNSVVYACHRVIVLLDTITRKQRLLLGHTAKVKAMAVDHTGGFLVSVQHGSRPALRVWNLQTLQCTSTLKTKEVEVHALALSTDGYTLATVGRCRQGKKQTVALWDAAAAHRGGKLVQVDRAQCDASIDHFAFALTDPHCMVSCGRDNIRVWRVRRNQLRSTPVNLASFHGENLQFTDVSFAAYHSPRHQALKALVSASGGQVFEVDIATIKIVKVHRLSDSPLRCLHASPTHTVTGGEDRMLRVWPLGFGESKMEAEHAGAVCCVQTSPDEAKVLVGTTAGSVGVLDLQSKQYSTVMRAHLEPLVAMAARPDSFDVVSLSTDGTIIVWSLRTHEELFDFQIPDDRAVSAQYHPHTNVLSCGFTSGFVRVFDVDTAEVICARQQHSASVTGVLFAPAGDHLFSCGEDGLLVMYDALQGYIPARVIHVAQAGHVRMAMSTDGTRLAYVGPLPHMLCVVDGVTLDEVAAIDLQPAGLRGETFVLDHIAYSMDGTAIFATTGCGRLLRLSVETGDIEAEVLRAHSKPVTSLAVHPKDWYIVTGSADSTVTVWDPSLVAVPLSQTFSGHGGPVRAAMFSNDGTVLMTGAEATFLWDVAPPIGLEPSAVSTDHANAESSAENEEGTTRHVHFVDGEMPADSPTAASHDHEVAPHDVKTAAAESVDIDHDEDTSSPPRLSPNGQSGDDERPRRALQQSDDPPMSVSLPPATIAHYPGNISTMAQSDRIYGAVDTQQVVTLDTTLGITSRGRRNALWHDRVGIFVFTSGSRVIVEDLDTREQQHLHQHGAEVSTLAINAAGDMLASACGPSEATERMAQICLWNPSTGVCLESLLYHVGDIGCLVFSSDDRRLVSVGNYTDRTVAVWDVATGVMLAAAQSVTAVNDVRWDPCGTNEFVTVGQDAAVCFWLLDEDQAVPMLNVHVAAVPEDLDGVHMCSASYNSDSTLYIGASNGSVSSWDTRDNACVASWTISSTEVTSIVANGSKMITGCLGSVKLWTIEGANLDALVLDEEMELDGGVTSMSFDSVAMMGVVSTTAATIWYINWPENSSVRLTSGHYDQIRALTCSSDDTVLASGGDDGTVRLWAIKEHTQILQFQVKDPGSSCLSVALSRDTTRCAVGYSSGAIRVFDVDKIDLEAKFVAHESGVVQLMYSSDGRVIISASERGMLVVSSASAGSTLRVFSDHKGSRITCFDTTIRPLDAGGASSMWLACGADRRITVWKSDWSQDTCVLHDWLTFPAPHFDSELTALTEPPTLARFTPSNYDIVVIAKFGRTPELVFHSVSQRVTVKKLSMVSWVYALDVSPSGQLIAVGTADRLLRLLDYEQGTFQDYVGGCDMVSSVRFGHLEPILISASLDNISVWSVKG